MMNNYPKRDLLLLALIGLLATIINANKAFHIDDTFYLEAAQWIEQNPLKPLSAKINWDNTSEPISIGNNPPLYYYGIALVGSITGYSEIPLHLFQALFTFLALFFFYRLAHLFSSGGAIWLTALFGLAPAFLVNQNLMLDIPLLSIQLAMMYALLRPGPYDWKRYSWAAFLFGVSMLLKYSSLPMIGLIGLSLLVQRRWYLMWVLLIPVGMLGLWSLFNYWEFGGFHLYNPVYEPTTFEWVFREFQAFLIILGAVSPFVLVFLSGSLRSWRFLRLALWVLALGLMIGFPLFAWNWGVSHDLELWMRRMFTAGGLLFVILALLPFLKNRKELLPESLHQRTLLFAWAWAMIIFMVPLAPFMATRHVLLILPPLMLLLLPFLTRAGRTERILTLALTAFLGLVLSVSDLTYADYYRHSASAIKSSLPSTDRVWTVGHWGWQWYAKKEGMLFYETGRSEVREGDLFVIPENTANQIIPDSLTTRLEVVMERYYEPTGATFFATHGFARFYNSFFWKAPWTFSREPVDTIRVYRVGEDLKTED